MKTKAQILQIFQEVVLKYDMNVIERKTPRLSYFERGFWQTVEGLGWQGKVGIERRDRLLSILSELSGWLFTPDQMICEIYEFYKHETALSSNLLYYMEDGFLQLFDFHPNENLRRAEAKMECFMALELICANTRLQNGYQYLTATNRKHITPQ